MKVKTRTNSHEVKVTYRNMHPRFVRVMVGTFLFAIFGGILANYSGELYTLLLLFVMPILYIGDIILSYIYKKIGFLQLYIYGFLALFIILYLLLSLDLFFYMGLIYFIIISLVKFIIHLKEKELEIRIQKEKERKAIEIFDVSVTDKNFLNHHNYFNDNEKENLYKEFKRKSQLVQSIIWFKIVSFIFFISGITKLFTGEIDIKAFIFVMGIILFFLGVLIILPGLGKYLWNYKFKTFKIYQAKMKSVHFIERKNKIFFY